MVEVTSGWIERQSVDEDGVLVDPPTLRFTGMFWVRPADWTAEPQTTMAASSRWSPRRRPRLTIQPVWLRLQPIPPLQGG
jgi:hypothetical protein